MRARGHEVVGVCAEGPLLDDVRAEGFRVVAVPFERRLSPLAHWRAFRALVRLFRAEQPDLVHAHMPISGFLARLAAWWAGVPRDRLYLPRLPVQPARRPGRARPPASRWSGSAARVTDVFLTVSARPRPGRAPAAHPPRRGRGRQRPRSRACSARPGGARAHPRRTRRAATDAVVIIAVSRLVWHKGYPELAAAMRRVPEAELWVVGERLDIDRGADMAALLRAAGLGERLRCWAIASDIAGAAGGGRHLRAAQPLRGPADVGDRGDAAGLPVVATDVRGPARAGGDGRHRACWCRRRRGRAGDGAAAAGRDPDCARAWARPARRGRWTAMTRPRCWRGRWTCWACRCYPAAHRNCTGSCRHDRHRSHPPRADLGLRQDRAGAVRPGAGGARAWRSCPPAARRARCASRGAGEGGVRPHRLSRRSSTAG